MKKELKKKLVLKKETISALSSSEEKQIVGGGSEGSPSDHWMNCYPFTGGERCKLR